MKRILLAALMLCSATTARAQVDYMFIDFLNNPNGFTTTLLFRNTNQYGDPTIIAIDRVFTVGVTQRVRDYCGIDGLCSLYGPATSYYGNVQHNTFALGAGNWEPMGYSSIGGGGTQHFWNAWDAQANYTGVLGCQVPALTFAMAQYAGRTCAADGYDGWMSVGLNYFTTMPAMRYSEADLEVNFTTSVLAGPNAMNVVPEPTTLSMLLFAVTTLGLLQGSRTRKRGQAA